MTPPYTAGDLSADLGLDDGYVSRSLQVLVDERLVERLPRGPVTAVSWEPLLRRIYEAPPGEDGPYYFFICRKP